MKRTLIAVALGLFVLGASPAHSIVGMNEHSQSDAWFVVGGRCVYTIATQYAYPTVGVVSVTTDPYVTVDAWIYEGEECNGVASHFWGSATERHEVMASIEPAGGAAVYGGLLTDGENTIDLLVSFTADPSPPAIDPSIIFDPPSFFDAYYREGEATAMFDGSVVSGQATSTEARAWTYHWLWLDV